MAQPPRISVIIVNYNGAPHLRRALTCLMAQDFKDFECFLIDNASSDGSMDDLPELDQRFTMVRNDENLGFAAANNQGAKLARGEWLVALNPDAFARPDWLSKLIEAADAHPEFNMLGSAQLDAKDETKLDGAGDMYLFAGIAWRALNGHPVNELPETGEVLAPCAAAAAYKREDFLAAGGFEERFFCYHEDVDLALKMRLAGGRCLQIKDAVVAHYGSATVGRYSDFSLYHGGRNRIFTYVRCMPPLLFWLALPAFAFFHLIWMLRVTMRGFGGAAWRSLKDGLKGWGQSLKERKEIQKRRVISSAALAKTLTWNPVKLFTRGVCLRQLD